MDMTLKLMADYRCFPLWEVLDDGTRNVNPNDLALSGDLNAALHNWAAAYDRTLNQDYPPDSGFATPKDEATFEEEGRRLWKELQSQLGLKYRVTYYSGSEDRLLQ